MNEKIINRIASLLSVKSLVTLCLTVVFAIMSSQGKIDQNFMTIYAVIIAFYFGTQSQKNQDAMDDLNDVITGGEKYRVARAAMTAEEG